MFLNLLIGLPVTLLCLLLQVVLVALCLRRYVDYRQQLAKPSFRSTVLILSLVMLLMLFGNFLQMAIWAGLFVVLGEFETLSRALYFSGVTFATLGYGDVVLSPPRQLLSAVEAAN
ncbi:MAG TPA: ion channel, partial [Pseudomonas sp.]|nr:ion channel [Pseudomonas sp.]